MLCCEVVVVFIVLLLLLLFSGRGGGEEGRTEGRKEGRKEGRTEREVPQQKQKPHNTMWGKMKYKKGKQLVDHHVDCVRRSEIALVSFAVTSSF